MATPKEIIIAPPDGSTPFRELVKQAGIRQRDAFAVAKKMGLIQSDNAPNIAYVRDGLLAKCVERDQFGHTFNVTYVTADGQQQVIDWISDRIQTEAA